MAALLGLVAGLFAGRLLWILLRHTLDQPLFLRENYRGVAVPTACGVVIPLRHYESGAQLVSVAGARFAYGTSLEQCCSFAAFDRIGNAQMLSRVGIALGGGTRDELETAKRAWVDGAHLQPLRRLVEEIMVLDDWAESLLAIDLVDSLVYPLVYRGLDEHALLGGAVAYSLVAQHFSAWFADQRKWIDALVATWATDPEHATAHMTHSVLGFNEQLERIVEVAVVLIIGGMLWYIALPHVMLWFAPALFVFKSTALK